MIHLQTAVTEQYDLGYENLEEEDHYLLEKTKKDLLKETMDVVRGWLCEILIACGEFASARLESLRDRGETTHTLPPLLATEMRKYHNWRKVCLQQHLVDYD